MGINIRFPSMIATTNYANIADVLTKDGIILIPTDTVWCLATLITSEIAVKKISLLKKGVSEFPLTILVDNLQRVKSLFPELHPRIETLLYYHQRPLRVLYPRKKANIPSWLMPDFEKISFRIEQNDLTSQIIQQVDKPLLVATAKTH